MARRTEFNRLKLVGYALSLAGKACGAGIGARCDTVKNDISHDSNTLSV